MQLTDTLMLDGIRRNEDGALVASVRAARTGVQDYAGYELGRPDLPRISVYRPETEVFSRDSMRSFANAPVTIEHPANPVTVDNWKDHAVGDTGEDVVRDGEFVRVPLILRDADAIDAVSKGKREISMGYSCELEFVDGVAPDGRTYQAIQRKIKVNHLAVVDRARGGPELKLSDRREAAEPKDGGKPVATKTITFDGLPLEVTDAAEAAIAKLQGQIATLTQAKDAAETQVGTLTATIQTKDGEIAGLNAKLKDAEVTPARLAELAASRSKVIDSAKRIAGDELVVDGLDEAAIRRAAVNAKLGDAAKDMSDAAVEGAFSALAAAAPSAPAQAKDGVGAILANGGTVALGDAAKKVEDARREAEERDRNAWRSKAAA